MKFFIVNSNDSGQRLDKFIKKVTWNFPNSLMYKSIRKKNIKVNHHRAVQNQILEQNDVVEMYISDEFFESKITDVTFEKVNYIPKILYEDNNLIICDKQPGMLVHDGDKSSKDGTARRSTLLFFIQAYLYNKGEFSPEKENSFNPSLCNRIDRNTGGIVIAAKNSKALRAMNEAIRNNDVQKYYLCAVHGRPNVNEAIMTAFTKKDPYKKHVSITDNEVPDSEKIVTKYKFIKYNKKMDLSLLEVELITGKTHQIRAHMQHVDMPLLGEGKYGNNKDDKSIGFCHQALYSYKVIFNIKSGYLDYLNGKKIEVDNNNIDFLRLFNE